MDVRGNDNQDDIENDFLTNGLPDLGIRRLEAAGSLSLPKLHRVDPQADDCPDIVLGDVVRLKTLLEMDDVAKIYPLDVLVNAMFSYHDIIDPYINVLKVHKKDVFEIWQFLYKIILELGNAAEVIKQERFYVMDESLRVQEQIALDNLSKDEVVNKQLQNAHMDDMDKRREEIVALGKKVEEIKNAKTLAELEKFDKNPGMVMRAKVQQQEPKKMDCWATFFSYFPCSQQEQAVPVSSGNPEQDAKEMSEKREKLLKLYQDEVRFKEQMYNERMPPIPQDTYQSELNRVKAKIYYEHVKYFRCLSRDVMLICLRMYVMAFRLYYLNYGEDPLVDVKKTAANDKKKIKPIRDEEDKKLEKAEEITLKAKEVFRQMVRGMRSHLNSYYCLQPDRCDFTYYLDNYVHIASQEVRDAILAGRGTDEMLESVFRDYESRDEAFDPSWSQGPDV